MMVKFNGTTSSTWRRSPRNPGCESLNTWSSAMIMLIVCNQTKDINMWMILQSQNSYLSLPVLEISHPTTVSSMCHQIQEPTNFIFINLIYTQNHVDTISEWTRINKMMHNSAKSNYMIFNMRYGSLCTRLNLESNIFEKVSATKRLGVWIRFRLGIKYFRAVQKGIFSNILTVQIKICWFVHSGSTQNLYIVYTRPTGVCLCGLALHTDGQPDLCTRTSAETLSQGNTWSRIQRI